MSPERLKSERGSIGPGTVILGAVALLFGGSSVAEKYWGTTRSDARNQLTPLERVSFDFGGRSVTGTFLATTGNFCLRSTAYDPVSRIPETVPSSVTYNKTADIITVHPANGGTDLHLKGLNNHNSPLQASDPETAEILVDTYGCPQGVDGKSSSRPSWRELF